MKDIVEYIDFVEQPCPSKISRSISIILHAQPIIVSDKFLVIFNKQLPGIYLYRYVTESLVRERCRVSAEH